MLPTMKADVQTNKKTGPIWKRAQSLSSMSAICLALFPTLSQASPPDGPGHHRYRRPQAWSLRFRLARPGRLPRGALGTSQDLRHALGRAGLRRGHHLWPMRCDLGPSWHPFGWHGHSVGPLRHGHSHAFGHRHSCPFGRHGHNLGRDSHWQLHGRRQRADLLRCSHRRDRKLWRRLAIRFRASLLLDAALQMLVGVALSWHEVLHHHLTQARWKRSQKHLRLGQVQLLLVHKLPEQNTKKSKLLTGGLVDPSFPPQLQQGLTLVNGSCAI